MPHIFYYILKVIFCSAILFGYYQLFLRNKIYHGYNRFFLLAAVFLSLIVPLVNFDITDSGKKAGTTIQILDVVNTSEEYLEEVIIESHRNNITKSEIVGLIYLGVVAAFLLTFILALGRIVLMIGFGKKQLLDTVVFIPSNARGTPFSFFRYLFWNTAIEIGSPTGKRVLAHELAHIREKHSLDKIFINIVLIPFWINPFFWLIRKELNVIHEFIADKKAIGNEDAGTLASMILHAAYPQHQVYLTNPFFYSSIKRRINMLSKYSSAKTGYIARIIALPVILFIVAAFTLKTNSPAQQPFTSNKKITVIIDPGHGGQDGGAFAADGSKEKDIALSLSKRIRDLNISSDISILLTRESDVYMTPKEKSEFAVKMKADLFISVHVASSNPAIKTTARGMEVFVAKDEFKNASESKLLASAVINLFKNNYELPVYPNPKQRKEAGIWVLQNAPCPAILIEAGYMSNTDDLKYLKSEAGQNAFALNIINSIAAYAYNLPVSNKSSAFDQLEVNLNAKDEKASDVATDYTRALVIIDGKEYERSSLENKYIESKETIFYDKNDKEMIAKYGERAKHGVIIMRNATIKDRPSPGIVTDSQFVRKGDAVTRLQEKLSDVNKSLPATKEKLAALEVLQAASAAQIEETTTDRPVFSKVEVEPGFPGGKDGWQKYLFQNLDPAIPINEGWTAGTYKIVVSFVVDEQGNVKHVTSDDFKNSKTTEAAIALIKNGPKWIPAMQNGKKVSAYKKQPITFVVSAQ